MRLPSAAYALTAALVAACTTAPAPPPSAPASSLLEDVRILSADGMEGRAPGTEGSRRARAYILSRFDEIGLEPAGRRFEQPFVFTEQGRAIEGVNLVAKVEGRRRGDRTLVVMAHYDHEGIVDGEIYNGADDNASGVAALLVVAESFMAEPPEHDIIIAVLDAEEGGARGAHILAADPPVPLSKVVMAVNFDMLSKNARGELYAAGAHHFPFLAPRLEAIAARAPVTLKLGHDSPAWGEKQDWTGQSDHVAFHERGIPWVYFGVEDHPEYHRPTDDFATVPHDFFHRSARTVLMAVRQFDADLSEIAREAGR